MKSNINFGCVTWSPVSARLRVRVQKQVMKYIQNLRKVLPLLVLPLVLDQDSLVKATRSKRGV
jgi:hypothetical protein